jgi:hypothetical protein
LIRKSGLAISKKEWSDLQMKLERKRKALFMETGGTPDGSSWDLR